MVPWNSPSTLILAPGGALCNTSRPSAGGSLTGPVYQYVNGSYQIVTSLQPNVGYWFKNLTPNRLQVIFYKSTDQVPVP